jgi:preprotein translocase subunit YajC
MFINLANILAMSPQGQQGGAGSLISMLVMFGAVILIMYFLMIRPQQKRQKEHQKMIENLKRGDKVVTTAGIHGNIVDIDGSSIVIQVSENVKITFEKTSIAAKK